MHAWRCQPSCPIPFAKSSSAPLFISARRHLFRGPSRSFARLSTMTLYFVSTLATISTLFTIFSLWPGLPNVPRTITTLASSYHRRRCQHRSRSSGRMILPCLVFPSRTLTRCHGTTRTSTVAHAVPPTLRLNILIGWRKSAPTLLSGSSTRCKLHWPTESIPSGTLERPSTCPSRNSSAVSHLAEFTEVAIHLSDV
ncbi:hypothetical protein DFH06DRAFT_1236965 [Mycena polygramma]|nr:hypothetical protein DFH06DRAFT_1236965 [Mycena polygramma]